MSTQKTYKKRVVVGSICDGKLNEATGVKGGSYIKFSKPVTLKEGSILSIETVKQQLENVEKGLKSGRLSEELGTKIRERIEATPSWVKGHVLASEK